MSCPTCDHTMSLLCIAGNGTYYHCPRCGTIRLSQGDKTFDYVPKLVTRCRAFAKSAMPGWAKEAWAMHGIAESINLPNDRPT